MIQSYNEVELSVTMHNIVPPATTVPPVSLPAKTSPLQTQNKRASLSRPGMLIILCTCHFVTQLNRYIFG